MVSQKSDKESTSRKLGGKIERVGDKISEKAPKTGKVVHDIGDKIEHMQDKKTNKG